MTETQPELSSLHRWLKRLWPVYCVLVLLATFGYTRFDPYQIDGDAVAYMDIGDLIRSHQWAGVVNGYWHPLYPAALALGKTIFRSTRWNELHAFYMVNFGIFVLELIAIVLFADAVVLLREVRRKSERPFLLGRYPMRYFAVALLVIASQRELSLGKVRPDALLQALLLLGFAALLTHLAMDRTRYAALMGIVFGLAFLTKSFAFPITLLSLLLLAVFSSLWLRRGLSKTAISVAVALVCFALIAGPYIVALSKQKGRLNFGESGSLNYAWYVGGTEKMHLQNGTPALYGTSDVALKHPERILLTSPVVASYEPFPYGTYPPWFDATFFNDRIKTHINWRGQIKALSRDCVLIVRYLFNHPEGWVLLLLLVFLGARPDLCRRLSGNGFWVVPLALGIAIFGIYAMVNIEERYVTIGWFTIALTLAASMRAARDEEPIPAMASAIILLLALLAVGTSVREVFQLRRDQSVSGLPAGWYSPSIFRAAQGLEQLGVKQGDTIACAGTNACLYDHYWARLAGVRLMTELYLPEPHPYASLATTPNLEQAIAALRSTGATIVVGRFDPLVMQHNDPVTANWISLGGTDYYALRLNPPSGSPQAKPGALP